MSENIPEDVQKRLTKEELGKPYIDVKGGGKIAESGGSAQYVINNTPDLREHLTFGSVALICDLENSKWYGTRVTQLKQHWPYETDKEGELLDYKKGPLYTNWSTHGGNIYSGKLVADVELLSSFDFEDTFTDDERPSRKPVSTVPGPASVLLLPQQETENEPTLSEILDIPASGINVGLYATDQEYFRDSNDNPLIYKLDLGSMENEHVFVAGTTGTGKTVFLKNYVKQAVLSNYSVFAHDIQGDIIQMILPWEFYQEVQRDTATDMEDNQKDLQEVSDEIEDIYDKEKKIRILYPLLNDAEVDKRGSKIQEISRLLDEDGDKYEKVNIDFQKFSMQFSSIGSSEELQMFLPYVSDQGADLLTRLFREFRRRLKHKTGFNYANTLSDFIYWCEDVREDANSSGQYLYPDELDGYNIHRGTFYNVTRNLDVLEDEGIFDIKKEPSWKAESDTLYIVYMYHLPDQIRHKYEYHVTSQLYKERDNHEAEGVYTMIDEAHKVIPRKARTYEESFLQTVAKEFQKIGREGRKYNLNLLISTQKPQDIHKVVYDMTSTEVAFRLSSDDARDMGVSREYREIIPQYDTGCAIIRSPENCRVDWVEIKTVLPKIPHDDPQDFFEDLDLYLDFLKGGNKTPADHPT